MLNQKMLEELLATAMSCGGDFAEVYAEHTHQNNVQFVDGKIDKIHDTVLSGVGIRVFSGTRTVYASTSDLSHEGLLLCARSVADALGEGQEARSIILTPRTVIDRHPVRISPVTSDIKMRTDLLKEGCFAAKEYSDKISQVQGTLLGLWAATSSALRHPACSPLTYLMSGSSPARYIWQRVQPTSPMKLTASIT